MAVEGVAVVDNSGKSPENLVEVFAVGFDRTAFTLTDRP